jgi:hypothetical protein
MPFGDQPFWDLGQTGRSPAFVKRSPAYPPRNPLKTRANLRLQLCRLFPPSAAYLDHEHSTRPPPIVDSLLRPGPTFSKSLSSRSLIPGASPERSRRASISRFNLSGTRPAHDSRPAPPHLFTPRFSTPDRQCQHKKPKAKTSFMPSNICRHFIGFWFSVFLFPRSLVPLFPCSLAPLFPCSLAPSFPAFPFRAFLSTVH